MANNKAFKHEWAQSFLRKGEKNETEKEKEIAVLHEDIETLKL